MKKTRTFASLLRDKATTKDKDSGCSAVRLAHLLWEQGVVGSNPATPTVKNQGVTIKSSSFFYCSNEAIELMVDLDNVNRDVNPQKR